MIRQCFCINEAQDKMYGYQNRVMNEKVDERGRVNSWCCTVCNDVSSKIYAVKKVASIVKKDRTIKKGRKHVKA